MLRRSPERRPMVRNKLSSIIQLLNRISSANSSSSFKLLDHSSEDRQKQKSNPGKEEESRKAKEQAQRGNGRSRLSRKRLKVAREEDKETQILN
jgi:hypothetical protein